MKNVKGDVLLHRSNT